MKKQINLGFSSIVMVFITICLITFATLSVLTAHADYRLSEKMERKTTSYYQADRTAKELLSFVDQKLFSIYQESSSKEDYYQQVLATPFKDFAPPSVTDIFVNTDQDLVTISYQVSISDVMSLHVTLKVHYPKSHSECFTTVAKWQTVIENEPAASDEFLNLYTGEE